MKTKFTGLFLVLFSVIAFGQQESQYTQYMYNTSIINPAYIGSKDVLTIFGLHRAQWVGLEGAPRTNNFSINSPIGKNVALGLIVVNDKIGPADENNFAAQFSYGFNVSENYKLSFGLQASANILNVDFTKLHIYNPSDPRFQNNIDNRFTANVGAGVYLNSDKTYFGVSVPYLIESKHYDGSASDNSSTFIASEKEHFYVIAGHVFDLNQNLKFKPSVLSKVVQGAPLQLDLSGNFLINDKFSAGLGYRLSSSFSALAGFQVTNSIFIGYAYDRETTELANYNSGSHEFFLRFELAKRNVKIMSPRFF
ncbi:PorP/SprF family type IX secretion system membrane protein [Flavobacterium capsici]|uniref:Type IX secretion system membrane protein PorP/SprF n=1 Tax=Flavobacterium capsici TaxID=3075618 RepID=A0AA96EV74_9FLAO|nr:MULTISPECIES: type IX secretion system membrane protein PorP/SprF [unclassified Flavobacterium]WNM18427.1 type IX secretion system membrane protein PorP/SprF [Flavobacterium sp. PMR2A8]WNM22478.1 type IX secretion system membrane protein PorP/SprF [Flavobacterium sp. PMTSA4]